MLLSEACSLITDRIPIADLSLDRYISTENMLPNKGGITIASSIPESGSVIKFKIGDILISNIRPYFKKIWKATFDGGCSPDVLCFRPNNPTEGDFIYYNLSQQDFFDYVMAGANGVKMPRGCKVHTVKWNISDVDSKQKIAGILSSLDDKIETNRAINARLEELAAAIFKSWFIDFEPFADGEFIEDQHGRRPKGWEVGPIKSITEILNGFAFKSETFAESGKYRLLTIKGVQEAMLNIEGLVYINNCPSKMPYFCHLNIGDMVVSLTGNVGRICFIDQNNLLLNQRVCKLQSKSHRAFIYFLFRNKKFKDRIISLAKGTAQANLSPIEMGNYDIIIPSAEITKKFEEIANPIINRIILNNIENSRLAALRDALLPRLMSGELIPE